MFQRILVALDGGAASEAALSHAILLAQAMAAEVEAIFVLNDARPFLDVTDIDPVRSVEDLTTAAEGVLSAAATRLDRAGVPYATRLLTQHQVHEDIATAIVAEANGWLADLIVMGSHERHGDQHLPSTGIAWSVMDGTKIPVLLAKH